MNDSWFSHIYMLFYSRMYHISLITFRIRKLPCNLWVAFQDRNRSRRTQSLALRNISKTWRDCMQLVELWFQYRPCRKHIVWLLYDAMFWRGRRKKLPQFHSRCAFPAFLFLSSASKRPSLKCWESPATSGMQTRLVSFDSNAKKYCVKTEVTVLGYWVERCGGNKLLSRMEADKWYHSLVFTLFSPRAIHSGPFCGTLVSSPCLSGNTLASSD